MGHLIRIYRHKSPDSRLASHLKLNTWYNALIQSKVLRIVYDIALSFYRKYAEAFMENKDQANLKPGYQPEGTIH